MKDLLSVFSKKGHVCPWWLAYTFDNRIRKLFHQPKSLFSAYIREGMTALDIGCGMGYFTIGLANLIGDQGRVLAVDLQQRMIDICRERAIAAGVERRIRFYLCQRTSLGISEPVDFALTFWMAHEVRDSDRFIREIYALLKPGGVYYLAEPWFHVPAAVFQQIASIPVRYGFRLIAAPKVAGSRAKVYRKE